MKPKKSIHQMLKKEIKYYLFFICSITSLLNAQVIQIHLPVQMPNDVAGSFNPYDEWATLTDPVKTDNILIKGKMPYGYQPENMVYHDNLLFYVVGDMIEIRDVSDPLQPRVIRRIDPGIGTYDPARGRRLCYHNGLLFLQTDMTGLFIFDVSDPRNPVTRGRFEGIGVRGMAAYGNYAYLAANRFGLIILDISDPDNPREIRRIAAFDECWDAFIHDRYLYYEDKYKIRIFDLANPKNPAELGMIDNKYASVHERIFFEGDTIYYTMGSLGFCAYDVTDKSNPVLINHIDDDAYWLNIAKKGNIAYVAGWDYLDVYDFTDLKNPFKIATITGLVQPYYFALNGRDAWFVIDKTLGIFTFDISKPELPEMIHYQRRWPSSWDLDVKDNTVYLCDTKYGIHVVDISYPDLPQEKQLMYLPDCSRDIKVKDSLLFWSSTFSGLWVFDISDPHAPVFLDSIASNEHGEKITVTDDYVYFASNIYGAHIIDYRDPRNLQILSTMAEGYRVYDTYIRDKYAFVLEHTRSLFVYDITDKQNPVKVGQYDFSYNLCPDRLACHDNYLFVGMEGNSIWVLDISDPTAPGLVRKLYGPGYRYDMLIDYPLLYVCNTGFEIWDISDIDNLKKLAWYAPRYMLRQLQLTDEAIYGVATTTGMHILEYDASVGMEDDFQIMPQSITLHQNYPNPFNPSTIFGYHVEAFPSNTGQVHATSLQIELCIMNILGQKVATLFSGKQGPGSYQYQWDASDVGSGIYFYRLTATSGNEVFTETKKCIVLK